jgi:hypothetical protein
MNVSSTFRPLLFAPIGEYERDGVIPAKAGIQVLIRNWIPAFAGMTEVDAGDDRI